MEDERKPNRAERRRREKEEAKTGQKGQCNECDQGPCVVAPRTFDKCPVCGCPARFVVKAMEGDLQLEDILGKSPALFSFEYIYDTPTHELKLVAVGASCARCGVFYTIARDKLKALPISVPRDKGDGGGPGGLILPGHGR